jgi:hypothetical protein
MTTLRLSFLAGRTPNTVVAAVFGAAYLVAGVVALAVSLGAGMASEGDSHDANVSVARMVAYIALGVILLAAAGRGMAKSTNTTLGAAYLLVGLVLLFTDRGADQLLTLNQPDNVIHLGSAALLLGIGRTQD